MRKKLRAPRDPQVNWIPTITSEQQTPATQEQPSPPDIVALADNAASEQVSATEAYVEPPSPPDLGALVDIVEEQEAQKDTLDDSEQKTTTTAEQEYSTKSDTTTVNEPTLEELQQKEIETKCAFEKAQAEFEKAKTEGIEKAFLEATSVEEDQDAAKTANQQSSATSETTTVNQPKLEELEQKVEAAQKAFKGAQTALIEAELSAAQATTNVISVQLSTHTNVISVQLSTHTALLNAAISSMDENSANITGISTTLHLIQEQNTLIEIAIAGLAANQII